MISAKKMSGRRIIKTSVNKITIENVLKVLDEAMSIHSENKTDIEYLWEYYKGNQPVLTRTKDVRPEICNKIVENRANEIVAFKVGYLCGEPIQYVSRSNDAGVTEAVMRLNDLMYVEDKCSKDEEIVEWQMICGTAFRLVMPDEPFTLHTLDPRFTFVVYSNSITSHPVMAVKYNLDAENIRHCTIYTEDTCFMVDGDAVTVKPHALGMIPIIEYPANNARLGSFEIVLPLLDAINNLESNRMDGVEQFIQAFWKFVGCTLDQETFDEFLEKGAIVVPPNNGGGNIDVDLIVKELNQDQAQTLKKNLYDSILTICGMPNRNGGSSTSDTGAAVIMRDGWSLAEARAKDSEHMFKRSEKQMLKLVLKLCADIGGLNLELKNVDCKFTRRNFENIQSKAQVLITMLQEPKIHPLLAFTTCGMFPDSEEAYTMSMEYYERELEKTQLMAEKPQTTNETERTVNTGGNNGED